MSYSFFIPGSSTCAVLCSNITEKELLNFPAFKSWFKRFQANLALQDTIPDHEFHNDPYILRLVEIQVVDRFGERIGFLKLSATIVNAAGDKLNGTIFMRGPSVGMLVLLQPDDLPEGSQDERYVLLTSQPRPAAGGLRFVELPAGMVEDGTFKGAAAKEIEEELLMNIPEDQLINLTELAIEGDVQGAEDLPRAMFPSAGGCDECIQLFMHERRVPREQLKEWTGKMTGLRDEGEKITLKLIKVEDLWWEGARDAKALSALALWENLKRTGKLK
ncbi:NUDIX family hydrolase-like protein [Amylocarpus encephaloides]|uniref:NUDIX family hydrolase-like protein n=1 Tax=Amylocarpus encephaloides TaxID=45428 RepID=A0A9P8C399_9HELO|nr:NUDIX family hydrolase-like protein [Amylocarpus encephaloides]